MSSPYVLRPLRTEAQARADIAKQRERAAATPPDWAHFPVAVRPCDAPAGRNGELATDPLSRPAPWREMDGMGQQFDGLPDEH